MFTVLGLVLIGAITVFVNDKPYWWRACQMVRINVDDATGLKSKSKVQSLGLEIGYLSTVELAETHVTLGICITAPVEVLPSTRAYIRAEGFLGDKFVELKPVKYNGPGSKAAPDSGKGNSESSGLRKFIQTASRFSAWAFESEARAEDARAEEADTRGDESPPAAEQAAPPTNPAKPAEKATAPAPRKSRGQGREIPVGEETQDVQHLVNRVDELVNEMTNLTSNLKTAINPEELRSTMRQLNRTLEAASRTLAPEGGLNQTAQRTLAKLEDAIEQMRDQMTRVNRGEGSVGMLLNDPVYADEIHEAIRNINKLLSKVSGIRFVVDVGAEELGGYDSARGWFHLQIWPRPDHYYLLGIGVDPRGKVTQLTTTTAAGGIQTVTQSTTVESTALVLTGMLGKVLYHRLDLSVGVLNNDGTGSVLLDLGPHEREEMLQVRADVYSRGVAASGTGGLGLDGRFTAIIKPFAGNPNPWSAIYVKGGLESVHQVNGTTAYLYGAGVSFDDEDIKLLFALR
jgi:phospholipid/cholesterol/gamma-HCH transport system substrate-binding protein